MSITARTAMARLVLMMLSAAIADMFLPPVHLSMIRTAVSLMI